MPRSGRRVENSRFAPAYTIFLALLKKEREERHISQRELGRRLGRHNNFVSACEMGDRTLNFVEVRAWCMALDLSWVEFTLKVDEALAKEGIGIENPKTKELPSSKEPSSPPDTV